MLPLPYRIFLTRYLTFSWLCKLGVKPHFITDMLGLLCWFNELRPECPYNSIWYLISIPTTLFVFEKFGLKGDKSTWSIFQKTHTCFCSHCTLSLPTTLTLTKVKMKIQLILQVPLNWPVCDFCLHWPILPSILQHIYYITMF